MSHKTFPLLRSVSAAATRPTSKIPHLDFHIVQRQTKRPIFQQKTQKKHLRSQARSSSTITHADIYVHDETVTRSVFDSLNPHTTDESTDKQIAAADGTNLYDEDRVNMYSILEEQHPDRILLALLDSNIGGPFVRYASNELFDRALLSLDPDYFIEPFKDAYRYLHHVEGRHRSIDDRLAKFQSFLHSTIAERRDQGTPMTLDACRHLLKWAAAMGDMQLAENIWKQIMVQDGLEADLPCLNHYCRAAIWSRAFTEEGRFGLRVLPRILEIRGSLNPPSAHSGYRTSRPARGIAGIRQDVLTIFRGLIERDHTADESTFINLMTSMGCEADIPGVKSILKSVWNVDVDMLLQYDEEEIQAPTFYDENSPLRPSENLLFCIAHVFGCNNDAYTAWLLVDYVSRSYNLPITLKVWKELLEWYRVLSEQRSNSEKRQLRHVGAVSPDLFIRMRDVMMDVPHNQKPDFMIDYLMTHVYVNKRLLDAQVRTIRDFQSHVRDVLQRMADGMTAIEKFLQENPKFSVLEGSHATTFFPLRRRFILEFLRFEATMQCMQKAVVAKLLRFRYWAGGRKMTEWERRRLPGLVLEFEAFLPTSLNYRITTGEVTISTKEHRDVAWAKWRPLWGRANMPEIMNQLLDTEDHELLMGNIKLLRQILAGSELSSTDTSRKKSSFRRVAA